MKIFYTPFVHFISLNFLSKPDFEEILNGLRYLEWQNAQSQEYLKDNSTYSSTEFVLNIFEGAQNGFQIFNSATFIEQLNEVFNLKITALSNVVFLKMTCGFFNYVHSDDNEFRELARLILYLSDPSEYLGGELVLHESASTMGVRKYKFPPNTLFGFKMCKTSFHSVNEVTLGERLCLSLTYS